MNRDWILDVLTDLTTFAEANGLPRLALRLRETQAIAETEIAATRPSGRVLPFRPGDAGPDRRPRAPRPRRTRPGPG